MKSLARGYMWWPGMNKDIELCVKECTVCQSSRKMPPTVQHPSARPEKLWSRLHRFRRTPRREDVPPDDRRSLEMARNTCHKFLDTSTATIELLRKSFASLGIPQLIVLDNAAMFTGEEFGEFLKKNGIRHVRSPPYHPASNGPIERAVQTFKEGMKRLKSGTLSTRLSRLLLRYRIAPHSSTGLSPVELMWGRILRSQLDLLLPDSSRKAQQAQDCQKQSHDAHSTERQFNLNDTVYARNYSTGLL